MWQIAVRHHVLDFSEVLMRLFWLKRQLDTGELGTAAYSGVY
jgi:hypothetical protein